MIQSNKIYTFIYCVIHDDGYVTRGNYNTIPKKFYKKTNQCGSCACDLVSMGIIKDNGDDFEIIKPVQFNYDMYGGGFKFEYFFHSISDDRLKNYVVELKNRL
jgi:hypothetical protein